MHIFALEITKFDTTQEPHIILANVFFCSVSISIPNTPGEKNLIFYTKIKNNLQKYKNPCSLMLSRKLIVNTIFKTSGVNIGNFKKYFTSAFFIQKPNFDPKTPDSI